MGGREGTFKRDRVRRELFKRLEKEGDTSWRVSKVKEKIEVVEDRKKVN